jgi:hypothetical protein
MLVLAKVALGLGVTAGMAGAYVFHEGVIRVDVDEPRGDGSHVHFWVPATVVATGMHFVPAEKMREAEQQMRPFLPVLREVSKELEKYPNVELVDVAEQSNHVRVAMVEGKLRIDAVSEDGSVVHVSVPPRVLRDVADEVGAKGPGI